MYKVFAFSSSVLHYFVHKICLEAVQHQSYWYLTRVVIEIKRNFFNESVGYVDPKEPIRDL